MFPNFQDNSTFDFLRLLDEVSFATSEGALYLLATQFCDSDSPLIERASKNILGAVQLSQTQKAKLLFHWVRDHCKYTVGLKAEKASETLMAGEGSCSAKANLLCALLRSQKIPCAFIRIRVATKKYFGPTSISRIHQFVSDESWHVFAAVLLEDRWLFIDPTDDHRMSIGLGHLSPQCSPTNFNGFENAVLNLNPEHVLSVHPELLPDIDDIMKKSPKLPRALADVFNIYIEFLRVRGVLFSSVHEIEPVFFPWLAQKHPQLWMEFEAFEKNIQHRKALEEHPADLFQMKSAAEFVEMKNPVNTTFSSDARSNSMAPFAALTQTFDLKLEPSNASNE